MTGRAVTQRRRLTILLALNVSMIVGLIVVGLLSRSMGVLAAGGDYVADSAAILLGIIALTVRERVGPTSRALTYVAAISATALLVVTVFVLVAATRRLLHGTPVIHGLPVLIVSALATGVMVAGVFVLGTGAGREDLHSPTTWTVRTPVANNSRSPSCSSSCGRPPSTSAAAHSRELSCRRRA